MRWRVSRFRMTERNNSIVPLSAKNRAFVALGVLAGITAACAGIYVHNRRTEPPSVSDEPPLDIFTQPPQTVAAISDVLSEIPNDAPALAYIDVAALRKLQGSRLRRCWVLSTADVERIATTSNSSETQGLTIHATSTVWHSRSGQPAWEEQPRMFWGRQRLSYCRRTLR